MKPLYETVTLNNKRKMHYLNAGRAQGRKILVAGGFVQSPNPAWLERGTNHATYNPIVKHWILTKGELT